MPFLLDRHSMIRSLMARVSPPWREAKVSFSQGGEDLIVRHVFDTLRIERPAYLDIGAYHPFRINNTYHFYVSGSAGANVEPNRETIDLFRKYRRRDSNIHGGVGRENGEEDYYRFTAQTLNCFTKEEADKILEADSTQEIIDVEKAPILTLDRILTAAGFERFPEFLDLDAEGAEQIVLDAIEYETNAPTVICLETIPYRPAQVAEKNERVIAFLKERGYFVFADTYVNSIFVMEKAWRDR